MGGSIRRECTDHLIVFSEEHLRRILAKYSTYYNEVRVHISLGKDAPRTRPIERFGDIVAHPILADCTIDTHESKFSEATGVDAILGLAGERSVFPFPTGQRREPPIRFAIGSDQIALTAPHGSMLSVIHRRNLRPSSRQHSLNDLPGKR
jgi:hypothetical protein